MTRKSYGFMGLGLIGGSIAKAIKAADPDACIVALDESIASLDLAKEEQIADEIFSTPDSHALSQLGDCEFVFLCAPVSQNDRNLSLIKDYLSEDTILTDTGSVKGAIHEAVSALSLSHRFIGGHPMAGSEKSGYENANGAILENAYYILTPGENVPQDRIKALEELVRSMRAIPFVLEDEHHDHITAAVSHLPHLIASGLVNLVHDQDTDGMMKTIAAGGFKDITRIASSSPVMWQSICLSNTEQILTLLDAYTALLSDIRDKLSQKDETYLYDFFEQAKAYRDSFQDASSGPIKKEFALYVDLKDETGALAKTANLLADAGISIKNIGIMHNREFQEGALRIEFYDESSMKLARTTLSNNQYILF